MCFSAHSLRRYVDIVMTLGRARSRVNPIIVIVLGFLAVMAGPAHAQATIRASTPPMEYAPFEVVVQTSKSYCYDATFPILGEVQYSAGTLSVVLSHLHSTLVPDGDRSTCGQERRFTLPGLPRGQQTVKVDVTEYGGSITRVSETITLNIDVTPFSTTSSLVNFWTGGFRSTDPSDSVRVFLLTSSRFAAFAGGWDWLEVGLPETGYTFKAFTVVEGDRLPAALARLYNVSYPDPHRGRYWTADEAVAQRLAAEWRKPISTILWAVGRVVNGACPISMSPVYQTYHPRAISHRWTQSRTAYAALLANGYQGDGASWCAPALRGE